MSKVFKIGLTIAILAFNLTAINAYAHEFSHFVVFGDSLSDNGNLFKESSLAHKIFKKMPIIPNTPYWQGRFSNGRTWAEVLAKLMHIDTNDNHQFMDVAYGGATVLTPTKWMAPVAVPFQVRYYLDHVYEADQYPADSTLYSIWAGANDYIDEDFVTSCQTPEYTAHVQEVVSLIDQQIRALIEKAHAKYIIVPNLPDFGAIPRVLNSGCNDALYYTQLTQAHNAALKQALNVIHADYPQVHLITMDIFQRFRHIIQSGKLESGDDRIAPVSLNVDQACYTGNFYHAHSAPLQQSQQTVLKQRGYNPNNLALFLALQASANNDTMLVCAKPNGHLFWDALHPTAVVHAFIAQEVLSKLAQD